MFGWRRALAGLVMLTGCGADSVAASGSDSSDGTEAEASSNTETDSTSTSTDGTTTEEESTETGDPPMPRGPDGPEDTDGIPPAPDSCNGTTYIVGPCSGDDMDLSCEGDELHLGVPICESEVSGPRELGLSTGIWMCGCYSPSLLLARDLDGDGADELLVGCSYESAAVLIWRGRHDDQLSCGEAHAIAGSGDNLWFRDVDEDGLEDLVSIGWNGFVSILFATAPGQYAPQLPIGVPEPLYAYQRGVEIDVDGDEQVEFLLTNDALDPGPVFVYGVEAGEITVASDLIDLIMAAPVKAVSRADIDGDGRFDLLGIGDSRWWAKGTAFGLEPALPLSGLEYQGGATWGDVDGDGLADAVWGGAPNPELQLGLGDGSFAAKQIHVDPDAPRDSGGGAAIVRDLDGDGQADVLLNAYDAGWSVWRSTPEGLRFDMHADLYENVYFAAGDFNADGKVDLASSPPLAAETNGQVVVWRAQP